MVWLFAIVLVYLLLLALIAWKSVTPFRTPKYLSPGQFGISQEGASFHTRDGVELRGWWMPAENARSVAVLCHGYMMNRCELAPLALLLHQRGVSCLVFDFRAHGTSRGKRTGLGWHERWDVEAAVKWVKERCPGLPVVAIGSSMGGAAIAFAAAEDPNLADAFIFDSAYSRLDTASLGWWRFLGGKPLMVALAPTLGFCRALLGFRLRDADVARALPLIAEKPSLILHGDRDSLALPSEAERNLAASGSHAKLVWFEGCDHSQGRFREPDRYNEIVLEFLSDAGIVAQRQTVP
ncbi:MAG TPA: alpha/beta hydrolase [Fimbriimonadaceae bacterium]|nr:alpha/beta hydrolase [Fimbriimonadaceae bacterium]